MDPQIVNGIKKWITNGAFADYFVTAVRTGGAVKDLGAAARPFLKCLSSAAASAPPPIALSPRPSRDTRAQTLWPSALSSRGHGCVSVMQAVTVCIWAHSSQAGAKRAGRARHGPIGHPGAAHASDPAGHGVAPAAARLSAAQDNSAGREVPHRISFFG